jgi:hypothetical protein
MTSAYGCWNLGYPASVHRDIKPDEIITVRDQIRHGLK